MKRTLFLIVATIMLLSLIGAAALAEGEQIVIDAPESVACDADFTITFEIGNVSDLAGFSLDMVFDPSLVNVNSATLHSVFGSEQGRVSEMVNDIDNTEGTLEYCCVLTGEGGGVDIGTPVDAISFNCTAQGSTGEWGIQITDDAFADLTVDADSVRMLLSDSDGQGISTNLPSHTLALEAKVTDVTLSSSELAMTVGDTETLTATVTPEGTTYADVVWSTSDSSIADVDQSGLVSATGTGSATITATADGVSDTCDVTVANQPSHIYYRSHVQDIGWQDYVCDGELSGTTGMAKRLEGMNIYIDGQTDAIEYRTHVQDYGWMDWVQDGAMTGTSNEAKRLEAIEIRLTGDMADAYDVYYRVHAQNFGWLGWACNGYPSGTAGYGYRLEAIEIVLVEKDGAAPGSTDNAFVSSARTSPDDEYNFIVTALPLTANYFFADGIDYENDRDLYIFTVPETGTYRFKTIGTTDTVGYLYDYVSDEADLDDNLIAFSDDDIGLNFGIEASLTAGQDYILKVRGGSISTQGSYEVVVAFSDVGNDIIYSSHVQDIGWQEYRCNGAASGTSNQAKRLEGMYIEIDGLSDVLEYRTHVQNIGWQDWVSDGEMTGTTGLGYRLEAIDIRLINGMEDVYDIYYRVHAQNFGWLDWACNGTSSGTAGFGYRLEAIEIVLVEKGDPAPGPTTTPFISSY